MADSLPSGEKPIARTLVFAALAAFLLVGLAGGWLAAPSGPSKAQLAALHRRAGDTYLRILYLTGEPDLRSAASTSLLRRALGYYLTSAREDPSDLDTLASLGVVLRALNRGQEARFVLSQGAARARDGRQRRAATAAWMALLGRPAKAEHIATARSLLAARVTGPLALTIIYQNMDQPDLGAREWRAAQARAQPLVPVLAALVVGCGLLVAIGLVGLIVAPVAVVRRRPGAAEAGPPAAWGIREAMEALLVWVIVATAGAGLLSRFGLTPAAAWLVVPSLLAGVAALAWVQLVSPRGAQFGWVRRHLWREVARGLAAAGLAAPVVTVLDQLLERMLGPWEHPLVPTLAFAAGPARMAALLVAACGLIPALEETLFRGILFRALRRQWPFWLAALGSAVVFGVGHVGWVAFLPYSLLGALFAWLYERSGSLVAPAVAHGAFNAFNLAILLVLYG